MINRLKAGRSRQSDILRTFGPKVFCLFVAKKTYCGKFRVGLARSVSLVVRELEPRRGSATRLRRSLSPARISAEGAALAFVSGTFFFTRWMTRFLISSASLLTGGNG